MIAEKRPARSDVSEKDYEIPAKPCHIASSSPLRPSRRTSDLRAEIVNIATLPMIYTNVSGRPIPRHDAIFQRVVFLVNAIGRG